MIGMISGMNNFFLLDLLLKEHLNASSCILYLKGVNILHMSISRGVTEFNFTVEFLKNKTSEG